MKNFGIKISNKEELDAFESLVRESLEGAKDKVSIYIEMPSYNISISVSSYFGPTGLTRYSWSYVGGNEEHQTFGLMIREIASRYGRLF